MLKTSRMCSKCSQPMPAGANECPRCGRTTAWLRAEEWLWTRATPCHVIAIVMAAVASTTALHEMTTGMVVLAGAVLVGAGEIVVALRGGRE